MKVKISTDTSCQINYEMLEKAGISTYPLNVIIDGKEYLDGKTISQKELCEAMRSGHVIKTSTPPLGEIIDYFTELFNEGYDKIIHFTISSNLSSMYELFNQVAKTHFPGKLFIFDSYSLSAVMLSQVLFAYDEVNEGKDVEVIIDELERRIPDNRIMFIPENLTSLKNGGRISPAIALIGNAIGIKPVLVLRDGSLDKETTTRKVKRTFAEFIDKTVKEFSIKDYDYTLVEFDAKEETFNHVVDYLKTATGMENIIVGCVPINVCAHCGPGTMGILISPKINGKSISDFN